MRKELSPPLATLIREACASAADTGASNAGRRRTARTGSIAAATLTGLLAGAPAHAIGLGELQVQSGLGQALRASIGVLGNDAAARAASCYSARLSSADGAFIVSPGVTFVGGPGGARLTLATSVALAEPALSLLVEITCGDAVRKEFMLLLDPPLASIAPVMVQAPVRTAGMAGSAGSAGRASAADGTRPSSPAAQRTQPAADMASSDAAAADSGATGSAPAGGPVAPPVSRSPAQPARQSAPRSPARPPPGLNAAATAAATPPTSPGVSPAAPVTASRPARNVLRMSTRASAADVDLINAIGLRLALADRLAGSSSPKSAAAGNATDGATLAADRAARSRFIEALQGDAGAAAAATSAATTAAAAQSTEQRLQQLQAKTRVLEQEAARLRLVAQQDAAARKSALPAGNDNLLLAGLIALLVASLAAIAWLARRMKHLQRRNTDWDWEESVSAADARAIRSATGEDGAFDAESSLEAEARAESAARAARAARAEAEARELQQAKAEAEARHSLADAFWETAAPPPVAAAAATPAGKPAPARMMRIGTVPAELSELAVLATTAAAAGSSIAMPAAPVVPAGLIIPPSLPVQPTPVVPMPVSMSTLTPTPMSTPMLMPMPMPPATQEAIEHATSEQKNTPLPFLPDLDFPTAPLAPAAPLEFTSSSVPGSASPLQAPMLAAIATPPSVPTPAKATGPADLQFAEIRMQSTSVEEISDVMQEAEFWLSLHDLERAAEVLEPYATYEQPGSPLPWLYLFELYRDLGWEEKYGNLRDRFQRIFNARALTWSEQKLVLPGTPQRGLEDVPHVALKVTMLWQTEEVLPYLESLLVDDRDGTRAGFDLPVYKEIMFLILLAYELQQAKQYLKPALGTPVAAILA